MRKLINIVLAFLIIFSAYSLPPSSLAAESKPYFRMRGAETMTASVADEHELVYDADDNALYYHAETNVVFNAKGQITYDNTSTPIYYNPQTKVFTNDKNDVLSLFERDSSRSGKYLNNNGYKVRSVSIDDTFWELPAVGGGKIYASAVANSSWDWGFLWVKEWTHWLEFYDFLGRQVTKSMIDKSAHVIFDTWNSSSGLLWQGGGLTDLVGFVKVITPLANKYPSATLFEWLDRIELVNEGSTVLGAMDNRGNPVNVVDGQVFDYFDYPIIGADCKPIYYDNGVYFNSDSLVLTIVDGYLMDGGKPVHSVVSNLLDGELLYFLFMRDGVTLCPLYGKPQADDDGYYNGVFKFTYLNGEEIDEADFILPEISEEDVYVRDPSLRRPDDPDDLVEAIGKWFSGIWTSIKSFLGKALPYILIGLGIILVLILLPILLPLFVGLLKVLWLILSAPVKGLVWLFTRGD